MKLLELDGSASLFQLSLSSLSVVLGSALENSLRSTLDHFLSFLQAQAGDDLADSLNNANLLSASVGQNDVELGLLLSGTSAALSRSASCNSSNRSSSLNVEYLFKFLNELGQFDEGHFLESFNELVLGELSHDGKSFLCCMCAARDLGRAHGVVIVRLL